MSEAPAAIPIASASRPSGEAGWTVSGAVTGALLTILLFWMCARLDLATHRAFADPASEAWPLVRALKALGTIWPWLIVAALLIAVDATRRMKGLDLARRGAFLLLSAALSGALADGVKILFRRERPEYHDGLHVFRPFTEKPLYGGGLDLPSSHAATAFGAAWALCALYPRLAWLWLALGAGCAATRVLEGAHTLSAVALGGAIAWAVARTIRAAFASDSSPPVNAGLPC